MQHLAVCGAREWLSQALTGVTQHNQAVRPWPVDSHVSHAVGMWDWRPQHWQSITERRSRSSMWSAIAFADADFAWGQVKQQIFDHPCLWS